MRRTNNTIAKSNINTHERRCPKNPDCVVVSVSGLKVSMDFGELGNNAEFQAPEAVRELGKGSGKSLDGAIHAFSDGSWHPVVGKQNGIPIKVSTFFSLGVRCCHTENESMLQFRLRPDLFPKMYGKDGRCVIAEIGTNQIEGAPAPWTASMLRLFALNCNNPISVFCLRCKLTIQMQNNWCSRGQGPCQNCTGNNTTIVVLKRSLQAYFDATGRRWKTVPDASAIFANSCESAQFTCNVCSASWSRIPTSQVQNNSGCPGCDVRHRAELCAYEMYQFVFPEASMYLRGQARIDGVHPNPYDVASANVMVIVEIMSLTFHVKAEKLPNDTEKMLAALCTGYVYILAHNEDYGVNPNRESAWKRSMVAALRMARQTAIPRVIHVRRDVNWTAYDCMRDAALAAEFSYQDVFCGNVNAQATERLPGDTHAQATLQATC
jgi:hypothetical protein